MEAGLEDGCVVSLLAGADWNDDGLGLLLAAMISRLLADSVFDLRAWRLSTTPDDP